MKFSVIVPTRNRPELCLEAVGSVLSQTAHDFELVVVNDGSADEHLAAYGGCQALCRDRLGEGAIFIDLPQRPNGHGPAFARNTGYAAASGDYICFLDDDDCWIDETYLETIADNIAKDDTPFDLHFASQLAYVNSERLERDAWIDGVRRVLSQRHGELDPRCSYPIEVMDLVNTGNHAHLNTTIIRRDLFAALDGFDEQLRYEEDRDLYLRAIDRAQTIRYLPAAIARHNVPDPSRRSNVSAIVSRLEKLLYQSRLIDKAILFSQTPAVKSIGVTSKRHVLKHMAEELYGQGRYQEASFYARQALLVGFNIKWLGFTLLTISRSWRDGDPATKGKTKAAQWSRRPQLRPDDAETD